MLKIGFLALAGVAGLAATAAAATSTDKLVSSAPWWEKVTVTIAGDGKPEACVYESSLAPDAHSCDVASSAATNHSASASKDEYTRITFERRFTPGDVPAMGDLKPGDTLLGGQVMALAIDPHGAVKNCRIVSASGDMQPDYGCDEATAERFRASVGGAHPAPREGYMTVLVYGHSEHMV